MFAALLADEAFLAISCVLLYFCVQMCIRDRAMNPQIQNDFYVEPFKIVRYETGNQQRRLRPRYRKRQKRGGVDAF